MPRILNIDTSTEHASICLAENDQCLKLLSNENQKEHAAWLHPAILDALASSENRLSDLDAIGITLGPGSYTGLRVGMSAAKGLCYALNIPLVGVNTLEAMAIMGIDEDVDYICPMIDARRMEVFTALYNKSLEPVLLPCAMVLDQHSFSEHLGSSRILFFGSGANKFKEILLNNNACFKNSIFNAAYLCESTYKRFNKHEFLTLAYAEPYYLKGL
jgi:tRNA threonylcarbamoyladenosine biosynthesis protein TsaB